jgi:hypothetical protein
MTMFVPISYGSFDRLLDFRLSFKEEAFERQLYRLCLRYFVQNQLAIYLVALMPAPRTCSNSPLITDAKIEKVFHGDAT